MDVQNQAISGAGLIISPKAISQIPPFANVAENIVWIDDMIKRLLHEGMRDIEYNPRNILTIRSVRAATFEQDRHPDGISFRDIQWHRNTYLPRLVLGCLMQSAMQDIRGAGSYAEYFQDYMRTRRRSSPQERERWSQALLTALERIRDNWRDFRNEPASELLFEYAQNQLEIDGGCTQTIQSIVNQPSVDINSVRSQNNCGPGCVYIAQIIADLERYCDLMDLWPFIVRTIDFETRNPSQQRQLGWLMMR
ncbi:hypothetical protein HYR99_12490 [Candidatus Poribacteria bacterium]|nr:hypothetical protein [Candidatus Poribacteria bacterium]